MYHVFNYSYAKFECNPSYILNLSQHYYSKCCESCDLERICLCSICTASQVIIETK